MSWALIAHSAIRRCSGIMAASEDICDRVEEDAGGLSSLFIFPDDFFDPGFFLWRGSLEQALDGSVNEHTLIEFHDLEEWINRNGEPD